VLRFTTGRMLTQTAHHRPGRLLHPLQRLLARTNQATEYTAKAAYHAADDPRNDF
jgi:hypothetical protein